MDFVNLKTIAHLKHRQVHRNQNNSDRHSQEDDNQRIA